MNVIYAAVLRHRHAPPNWRQRKNLRIVQRLLKVA
jgi:hypothetical protein